MSDVFHSPYQDDVTTYSASDMNAPLASLDEVLSKHLALVVDTATNPSWNEGTTILTWDSVIYLRFVNTSENSIYNKISAGSVSIASGEYAYVDLSETHDAALTVNTATLPVNGSQTQLSSSRVVLAYNSGGRLYPVYLTPKWSEIPGQGEAQTVAYAATMSVDISAGEYVDITLTGDGQIDLSGAVKDGQPVLLRIRQDATGGHTVSWGTMCRASDDVGLPDLTTLGASKLAYVGFRYNSTDSKYDIMAVNKGF